MTTIYSRLVGTRILDPVALSTGVISGLELQATVGGTTFSVTSGEFFVQDLSDPSDIRSFTVPVNPGSFLNVAITNIATADFTYVFALRDPGGQPALLQRTTPPVVEDVGLGLVYLGNLTHDDGTGTLTFDPTNLGWVAYGRTLEANKAAIARGTVRESGVALDFNGNGLTPVVTAGVVSRTGAGRLANPLDPDRVPVNPHPYGAGVGPTLRTFDDGVGGNTVEPETAIVPANFDDGSGVLALGNANRYYVHRFFSFPIVGIGGQVVFHQFGTTSYLTLEDAVNSPTLPIPAFLEEAAVVGTLNVQGSSTDPWTDIINGAAVLQTPPTIAGLYR